MAEVIVRFDLKFSNRAVRLAMAGAMLLAAAPELASESVTLTTYYPAPSGVYTQLIATSSAFLARDGGQVDIGTNELGAGYILDVNTQNAPMRAFDATTGGVMLGSGGPTIIGLDSGSNPNHILSLNPAGGNVGISNATPGYTLDVNGTGRFSGNIGTSGNLPTGLPTGWTGGVHTNDVYAQINIGAVSRVSTPGTIESTRSCSEVTFPPNGSATCPGGYITTASGFYSLYMTLPIPQGPSGPGITTTNAITALCCPCPGGYSTSGASGCDL